MKNILRKIKPAVDCEIITLFGDIDLPICKYDWCIPHAFGLPLFCGNIY